MSTATVEEEQVDFEYESQVVRDFRPLADWWSNRIQWSERDHEDLVQEGMLELIKTLRSYRRSGRPIQDVKAVASVCFSAAMKWWYKKSDRELAFTSFETSKLKVDHAEQYFAEIYVDQYLAELERLHGAIARQIAENLLSPNERVGEVALAAMRDKQAQHDAGLPVIGYASPGVQKRHIREALGLDTQCWDRTMTEIKSFTREFVCRNSENGIGLSKKASTALPLN